MTRGLPRGFAEDEQKQSRVLSVLEKELGISGKTSAGTDCSASSTDTRQGLRHPQSIPGDRKPGRRRGPGGA